MTEELKIQKERMDRAEIDVKAKMKDLQSALAALQVSSTEHVYVGTPVGSPMRPNSFGKPNMEPRPTESQPGFSNGRRESDAKAFISTIRERSIWLAPCCT